MKRVKKLLIVLTLNIVWGSCWVSSANAGVITMGTWTTMDANAFWNNPSWDGPGLNAGEILAPANVTEYLSAGGAPVAFAFDQSEFFWEAISITAWNDGRGIWQLPDGSVNFTTHGYTYNTLTTPQQFALFRFLGASTITYILAVEDMPISIMHTDRDYNDYIGFSIEQRPTPTPEPGTLALMLCGGLAAFRKLRSRKS